MWPFKRTLKAEQDAVVRHYAGYLSPEVVGALRNSSGKSPSTEFVAVDERFAIIQVRDDQLDRIPYYMETLFLGVRDCGGVIYEAIPPLVVLAFPDGSTTRDPIVSLKEYLNNSVEKTFKMAYGKTPCLQGTVASGGRIWFGNIMPNMMALISRVDQLKWGDIIEIQ